MGSGLSKGLGPFRTSTVAGLHTQRGGDGLFCDGGFEVINPGNKNGSHAGY